VSIGCKFILEVMFLDEGREFMKRFVVCCSLVVFAGFGFTLTLTSCGDLGGTASCEAECDSDSDCESGLSCFTLDGTSECLPENCQTCFEQGETCYYEENTQEQQEGEDKECTFRECT
jgi:hypothetical protein